MTNVFPMAITFNGRWAIEGTQENPGMNSVQFFYYQIVIRMLSVFYGKPLEEISEFLNRC